MIRNLKEKTVIPLPKPIYIFVTHLAQKTARFFHNARMRTTNFLLETEKISKQQGRIQTTGNLYRIPNPQINSITEETASAAAYYARKFFYISYCSSKQDSKEGGFSGLYRTKLILPRHSNTNCRL